MRVLRPSTILLLLAVLLGGCAIFTIEQRTVEGPTADDIWKTNFRAANGRSPRFEESRTFEDELDRRVRAYLARNSEVAYTPRAGQLRFWRQVTVGMTKEEVSLLLGKPQETTDDPARMELLARKFWPMVKPKAKEAWLYPPGWTLYFDGNTLTDITQYHRAFLHP
ncbi:MAG: hypothetical protein HY725_04700 [Candidatus Rokubacteria bacterium]|nr:hypothetical protein [Candidatus Rokubacteria bacterium]